MMAIEALLILEATRAGKSRSIESSIRLCVVSFRSVVVRFSCIEASVGLARTGANGAGRCADPSAVFS